MRWISTVVLALIAATIGGAVIYVAIRDEDDPATNTPGIVARALRDIGNNCRGAPTNPIETTFIHPIAPNYEDGFWYLGCQVVVTTEPPEQYWYCFVVDDDMLEWPYALDYRKIGNVDTPCEDLDEWPSS